MQSKVIQFIPRGMNRDMSKSKLSSEYMYDAMNIRITARENSTMLSVTNEKGNKEVTITPTSIQGTYLGNAILNDYVILFTTANGTDRIYKLRYDPENYFESSLLYQGSLNFSIEHPIETLPIYENEDIQKVYWVDGVNQPRVINLNASSYSGSDTFDFVKNVTIPAVNITKVQSTGGMFPSGVIQYAMAYYRKYGQESAIVYTSPLFYLAPDGRGSSPEDSVSNAFSITINNTDRSFDYVRIFSIIRTSIDATPVVRIVADLATSTSTITYTDTGTVGETVDPTELLYLGGEPVSADTMCQKDNTLFIGNLKLLVPNLGTLKSAVRGASVSSYTKAVPLGIKVTEGSYPYTNQLSLGSSTIKGMKSREWYRIGFRAIHKTGKKSEVLWIADHYNTAVPSLSGGLTYLPAISAVLPSSVTTILVNSGFVAVEPMIVFPSESDRECVCQGLVCPTVYNVQDRNSNGPFAQSSWFTRPSTPVNLYTINTHDIRWPIYDNNQSVDKGAYIEYRHNEPLFSLGDRGAEIQSVTLMGNPYISSGFDDTDSWLNKNANNFYVDKNIVTLHSPEIELGAISNVDSMNLSFRVVATAILTASASDLDITTTTPKMRSAGAGFVKPSIVNSNNDAMAFRALSTYAAWVDGITRYKNQGSEDTLTAYYIYPWQRTGSLTNYGSLEGNDTVKPAMLKNKKMSVMRFFGDIKYLSTAWTPAEGITNVGIFNSNELGNVRLKSPVNSGLPDINYYGNFDKVLSPNSTRGYDIYVAGIANVNDGVSIPELVKSTGRGLLSYSDSYTSSDPVSMKYKSSPHAVFAFNYRYDSGTSKYQPVILPAMTTEYRNPELSKDVPFWNLSHTNYRAMQDSIPSTGDIKERAYMLIGELYRPNVSNRFGGTTDEAIEANIWMSGGSVVNISTSAATLYYTEGDTYFQRFDSLKTYAYTNDDYNSIVDIPSFLCETRLNIDGRYDRNRGQLSNLTMSPVNFNLFNPVYSQNSTFFTGRALNYNKLNISNFKNVIAWSKEKTLGELIDTWTDISMTSTLDLDGDKGQIRLLKRLNNNIIAFQDKGICNVLFNSRVQIPASDNVPIEITNSYKVDGKVYINNNNGIQNKWAHCVTPSGMYFIDNLTNDIILFDGQQFKSLSSEKGFRTFINQHNSLKVWNSRDFNNFIVQYDATNDDVYFIKKDICLCYSELIQQFTSFYNYENVPFMFNMKGNFYSMKNNTIWQHELGDYNSFYGEPKPYYVTVVCNPDEPVDKIFNIVEYRADFYDQSNVFLPAISFDKLEVWNEYQSGMSMLTFNTATSSSLKKKFNVWRALVPRDNSNGRDRIRNTWAFVKLSNVCKNNYRAELHDIMVHYNI